MTALSPMRPPLALAQRRFLVALVILLALLATLFLWLDLQMGFGSSVFSALWLLCQLAIVWPVLSLWRRFSPLPDMDDPTDERQQQRHLLAYRRAFYLQAGLLILASQVYFVGHLRGWTLPDHPLTPLLALIWVGVLTLLPTLVFAWTEPDFAEE